MEASFVQVWCSAEMKGEGSNRRALLLRDGSTFFRGGRSGLPYALPAGRNPRCATARERAVAVSSGRVASAVTLNSAH